MIDAGYPGGKGFPNEKLGYKIREAQMQKIPYMLVIGDREMAEGTDCPPAAGRGESGSHVGVEEFIALIQEKCAQFSKNNGSGLRGKVRPSM